MKKQILLLVMVATCGIVSGQTKNTQNFNYKASAELSNANYHIIVARKRAELNLLDLTIKRNSKAQKQFERWAYIWKDRINADGTFPSEKVGVTVNEYLNIVNLKASTRRGNKKWTQVGPVKNPNANDYEAYPGKGRINVVAVDPTNFKTMFAGACAGGIWKSTDGGKTWAPKSDFLAGIGVTDILIDKNNTQIIYMATGDADAQHISSVGLFKSTDGGETWKATGLTFKLTQDEYIRAIALAPNDSKKIFVLTNDSIKVSTNSGATWSNVTVTYPASQNPKKYRDIIFNPFDDQKVIVSDNYGAIYYSTNGGTSFAMHKTLNGGSKQNILRLTTSLNDTNYFHGVNQNGLYIKYRYAINNTANDLIDSAQIGGFSSQAGYNVCIAVSPLNKDEIIIGGVRGYTSDDGGLTFKVLLNPYNTPFGVGFYVHPDHHHMSFLPGTDTIINGHDGGVHIGRFNDTGWTDLSNGLVISQPYNIAITQTKKGDDFMMANQDNDGFSKVLKDGKRQWVSAEAGDGTCTAISNDSSNIRYLGGAQGILSRSDDGWSSASSSSIPLLDKSKRAAFVSPIELHPTNPSSIYVGHDSLKKSTNRGNSFTNIESGIFGVNFIDVTANGSSVKLYIIGDGTASMSSNDGKTWTYVDLPNFEIPNSFSAKPNSKIVYVTASGYLAGKKVFKSIDNGKTWTNISYNLPNIIMKKVLLKKSTTNDTLYLGTELGVYWKDNSSKTWKKLGSNLPNVIVTDLDINYKDNLLYIGTFGRGMWKYSIGKEDTDPPVADVDPLPELKAQCSIATLKSPTATDAVAGKVTGTHTMKLPITADTTIVWTYTDGKNTSTQEQKVRIKDTIAPIPNTTTLADITAQCTVDKLTAPEATDNCKDKVIGTHTITLPITANTTIVWTYTDGKNTSTQIQKIIISSYDTSVTQTLNTLRANATGFAYQWIDCGNNNKAISGETKQSYTATKNGSYAVVLSKKSCKDSSSCYSIHGIGLIENGFGNNFSFYPNPTTKGVFINFGETKKTVIVIVRNVLQQKISEQKFNNASTIKIDINAAKGIYFIDIKSGKGEKALLKVIKN